MFVINAHKTLWKFFRSILPSHSSLSFLTRATTMKWPKSNKCKLALNALALRIIISWAEKATTTPMANRYKLLAALESSPARHGTNMAAQQKPRAVQLGHNKTRSQSKNMCTKLNTAEYETRTAPQKKQTEPRPKRTPQKLLPCSNFRCTSGSLRLCAFNLGKVSVFRLSWTGVFRRRGSPNCNRERRQTHSLESTWNSRHLNTINLQNTKTFST